MASATNSPRLCPRLSFLSPALVRSALLRVCSRAPAARSSKQQQAAAAAWPHRARTSADGAGRGEQGAGRGVFQRRDEDGAAAGRGAAGLHREAAPGGRVQVRRALAAAAGRAPRGADEEGDAARALPELPRRDTPPAPRPRPRQRQPRVRARGRGGRGGGGGRVRAEVDADAAQHHLPPLQQLLP
eukprot:485155-Rhodomonas_salina.1